MAAVLPLVGDSRGMPRSLRDFRAGLHHAVYCLGCCWALMVVLVAVGTMNILAMVALALVILLEKQWSRGVLFSRLVGVAALVLATHSQRGWKNFPLNQRHASGIRSIILLT